MHTSVPSVNLWHTDGFTPLAPLVCTLPWACYVMVLGRFGERITSNKFEFFCSENEKSGFRLVKARLAGPQLIDSVILIVYCDEFCTTKVLVLEVERHCIESAETKNHPVSSIGSTWHNVNFKWSLFFFRKSNNLKKC